MPTFLVNRKVDGLIFMGEIDRRYLATAIQSGLPFMLLDFTTTPSPPTASSATTPAAAT